MKYGHCANCYHFSKRDGYCSYHDRDVNYKCGCNKHLTLDEAIEAHQRELEESEDDINE